MKKYKQSIFWIFFISFLFVFFSFNVYASSSLDSKIGYYCENIASSTYISGGYYPNDGTQSCHYLATDLPSGDSWYGDLFYLDGSTSNWILLNGHSLSSSETFDKTESDNFSGLTATSSVVMQVVIYDYADSDCGSNVRSYFQGDGSAPSGCDWGSLMWYQSGVSDGDWTFSWGHMPPPSSPSFLDSDFGLIGNYFRDVLIWLFVPQESNLNKFYALKDDLFDKVPFSYYDEVKTIITGYDIPATSSVISMDFSYLGFPSDVSFLSFDNIGSFKSAMQTMFDIICWVFLALYFIFRIPTILHK